MPNFLQHGAVPAVHGLTAHFCLGGSKGILLTGYSIAQQTALLHGPVENWPSSTEEPAGANNPVSKAP